MPMACTVSALRRLEDTYWLAATETPEASRSGLRVAISLATASTKITRAPTSATTPTQKCIMKQTAMKTGTQGASQKARMPAPVTNSRMASTSRGA